MWTVARDGRSPRPSGPVCWPRPRAAADRKRPCNGRVRSRRGGLSPNIPAWKRGGAAGTDTAGLILVGRRVGRSPRTPPCADVVAGGGIRDLEHLRSVHVAGVWVGSTHHRSTIRVPDMFVMSVVAKSSSLEKEFHSTFDRFCNGTLPRVNGTKRT